MTGISPTATENAADWASNTFHPLGALLYTNTTYRETIKIIDQVDVPSIPFHNGTPAYVYDWQSGAIAPVPAATTEFKILLIAEIARYAAYWALEFGPLYSEPNYHHGVPEQWTVSTKQWLANHDYYALPVLFNGGMVAYGYGDMSQVPIVRHAGRAAVPRWLIRSSCTCFNILRRTSCLPLQI
jgi:hypothetical protein